jgi:hypothetical protein
VRPRNILATWQFQIATAGSAATLLQQEKNQSKKNWEGFI